MKRRKFAASAGTMIGIALSGCVGGSSGGGGDDAGATPTPEPTPEYQAYVNEDAPGRALLLGGYIQGSELKYGDRFKATIVVANTGGSPLSGEYSIITKNIDSSQAEPVTSSIVIDELESGDSEEFTVGPIEATYSGRWELTAGNEFSDVHEEFEAVAEVGPAQYEKTERIDFPGGLRLAYKESTLAQSLNYKVEEHSFWGSYEKTKVRTTLSDQIIVVSRFTAENAGTKPIRFFQNAQVGVEYADSIITPTVGEEVKQFGSVGATAATLSGTPLKGLELEPGKSKETWILTQVNISDLGDVGFSVTYDAQVETPEIHLELDIEEDSVPEFEMVEADIPSPKQQGEQEISFEIENIGAGIGTFNGTVEWYSEEDGEWNSKDVDLSTTLAPGETATVSYVEQVGEEEAERTYQYRFLPLGYEYEY